MNGHAEGKTTATIVAEIKSHGNFGHSLGRRGSGLSVSYHRWLVDEPLPTQRSQHRESGAGHLRADRGRERDCLLALPKSFSLPAHVDPVSYPDSHRLWFPYLHPALRPHVASEDDVAVFRSALPV